MTDALEVRLLRWGESSESGRTVTFLLADVDGEHPFKGLRYGKKGERFALALAKIEDTETKADHVFGETGYTKGSGPKDKTAPKSEGAKAVTRAVMLCDDLEFQMWISRGAWAETFEAHRQGGQSRPEATASILRAVLGIQSRRDIAADPVILDKFKDLEFQYRHRDQVSR